jgi:anti-sigma regulatory factor (Ser/Thr protein kinase)
VVVGGAALTVTLLVGFLLLLGLGNVLSSGVLVVLAGILHAAGTVGALWGWCRFFPHTLSAASTYRWQTAGETPEAAGSRGELRAPTVPAPCREESQGELQPEEPEPKPPLTPATEEARREGEPLVPWEESVARFEAILGELAVRLGPPPADSPTDPGEDPQGGEAAGIDCGEGLTTERLEAAEPVSRQLIGLLRSTTRLLEETDERRSRQKSSTGKCCPSSLARIRSQVEAVERLVGRLMDLARLEAGAWNREESWVALPEILQEAGDEFRDEAREQSTRVAVRVSNPAREVFTDPVLLTRAVRELLSNAVTHAGKGKQISLSATVTAGRDSRPARLRIRVRDSGRGVAKKDQERIFEAWETGASRRPAQDSSCSGLGLTLARACARRLGGDLSLESRSGKGSTFTLSVPTRLREESD